MINGELDEFRYVSNLDEFRLSFKQKGLNRYGDSIEIQSLPLRSLDGVNGRFYQIVFYDIVGKERYWSFTEPEPSIYALSELVEIINAKEEIDILRISLMQGGLNETGTKDEQQFFPISVLDGIDGRIYQIVVNGQKPYEKFWSFKNPNELLPILNKFIDRANKIDD
jgi:hypothetical protein